MRNAVPFFLLLAVASTAPAAAQSWQADLLQIHNKERARWNVAPLTWDPALAAGAERWAVELARSSSFRHSPRPARQGAGENLWMGTTGAYSTQAMAEGWLSERRWYRPGIFPSVSTTARWSDVGHYTQMIARRSTHVGCAIRSTRSWSYLVCRYWPSGNVDGRPIT